MEIEPRESLGQGSEVAFTEHPLPASAFVAQRTEHLFPKEAATGSNPVRGTRVVPPPKGIRRDGHGVQGDPATHLTYVHETLIPAKAFKLAKVRTSS